MEGLELNRRRSAGSGGEQTGIQKDQTDCRERLKASADCCAETGDWWVEVGYRGETAGDR